MTYLLFLIGAALLIFEFYTAGVGIAGVLGAGCFVIGCYGLEVLPTRPWALALLIIAMLGYAVDVQTGVAQLWSVIATACLVVGSLFLFDGFAISWITLLAGIVGISVSMISGMPAMIRTRFGTPTIGREWMIGTMGEAAEDIKREGVVTIDGAPWKARVNRTTPIAKGDPVRVVAIEGLYLEIEPEEGGARDYREMRGNRSDDTGTDTDSD
jgi:membrane-bound serine protease (ClpP class)